MPIYEYECQSCQQVSERERKHLERHDPVTCDHCGLNDTELIISRNSFALQGGGWYKDEYGGGGSRKKRKTS